MNELIATRKKMRELSDLLKKESFENLIFNTAPDAMFLINVEPGNVFRCISVNQAYIAQTKLKPEQVIGKQVEEVMPPESLAVALNGYIEAIKNRTPVKYEERVNFGFGLDIVETTITPVFDDNGICTNLIGASRNINTKIESENQVKMLAQTLRSINECVSITDVNNTIIYVNESFTKTYGYTEDELIGQHITKIKSVNSDPLSLEEVTKATLLGGWKGELMNRRKGGTEFPVAVSASPVFDDKHQLIAMVGVSQDLTNLKKTEQQLLDSEKWIKLITESTPDIIYVFSVKENRNIYFNRSIAKMIGYNEGELDEYSIGFLNQYIHPDDLLQFEEFYNKIQDWEPEFVYSFEYRMKTKQGDWRWFKGNEKEFQRENGKVVTLIGTVQDITEKKKAEAVILKQNDKFRFLSRSTTEMLILPDLQAIYKYICQNVHKQYPDSIVLMVSIDEAKLETVLVYVSGLENSLLTKASELVGYNPVGKTYKLLPDHLNYFRSGKFIEFPAGLAEFASTEFPAFAAKILQKMAGINKIYTIGINNDDNLLAALHIFTRNKTFISDQDYIESFIRQAGVIMQRKLMLETLKTSEEKYRLITENSADAIIVLDADLKFQYISPSSTKIIGFTPEEVMARELSDLVSPHSLLKLNQMLSNKILALSSKEMDFEKVFQLEVELIHKNGNPSWAESSISFLKDRHNKLNGIIAVVRDISERRKAMEQLRFQSLILDQIQDLVTATDINGIVTYVNNAELKMMGRSREEIIGKHVELYGEDPSRGGTHREILESTINSGQWVGEMVNFAADGTPIELEVKTQLIVDIDGNPIGLCGISSDASIRKQAERKLIEAKEKAEAADKLKTSFLNNISHEVRTPLNGILGYSGLLTEWDISKEEREDYLSMLGLSSDRLMKTITDYMDISLLTSGNMEIHPEKICPDDKLKDLFKKFTDICSNKNLSLILDLPEKSDSCCLFTDPELFSKLIQHLLDNAIKFTSSGSITFGYKATDSHLQFFVNDTGIGIKKENLEMIFKPFSQEDLSDTKGYEGSGLGLSIVKGIAELLGGTIEVKSERGKGSAFHFIIPKNVTTPPCVVVIEENDIAPAPCKQKLLIAEDDFASYKYFDIVLSRLSVDLLHATNGQEAVDLCRNHPEIGLVLMDLKMPVMTGLEATRIIKQLRPDLPIIAQTAFALSGDENLAREAGCDDYLPKPITKKALLEKLEEFGFSTKPSPN